MEYRTPTRFAVSESLDTIGNTIGAILVRGPDGWATIAPGPIGYVLTSNGPDQLPTWQPAP